MISLVHTIQFVVIDTVKESPGLQGLPLKRCLPFHFWGRLYFWSHLNLLNCLNFEILLKVPMSAI